MKNLKEEYIKLISNKISISKEDLTPIELEIIDFTFSLLEEKLEDIKLLNEDLHRIKIDFLNLKSSLDNSEYHEEE